MNASMVSKQQAQALNQSSNQHQLHFTAQNFIDDTINLNLSSNNLQEDLLKSSPPPVSSFSNMLFKYDVNSKKEKKTTTETQVHVLPPQLPPRKDEDSEEDEDVLVISQKPGIHKRSGSRNDGPQLYQVQRTHQATLEQQLGLYT